MRGSHELENFLFYSVPRKAESSSTFLSFSAEKTSYDFNSQSGSSVARRVDVKDTAKVLRDDGQSKYFATKDSKITFEVS